MRVSAFLIFFMLGYISSCSTIKFSDHKLQEHVEDYSRIFDVPFKQANGFNMKFETQIREEDGIVIGYCNVAKGIIRIHPEFYFEASLRRKQGLLYHELAHCVNGLNHDPEMRKDGCAKSLMHPNLPSNSCLRRYWTEYIQELKERIHY